MAKRKISKTERARIQRARAATLAQLKKVKATTEKLEIELKKLKKDFSAPHGDWWFAG